MLVLRNGLFHHSSSVKGQKVTRRSLVTSMMRYLKSMMNLATISDTTSKDSSKLNLPKPLVSTLEN